jgi:hypothetical protein
VTIAKTVLARDPSLLTESQFASLVVEVARLGGWKHFHPFDSRRSTHGFPDYVLVKGPRLLFVELKTEAGRVRPDQEAWLEALSEVEEAMKIAGTGVWRSEARVEVFVWRPSDWPEIVETLTGRKPKEVAA